MRILVFWFPKGGFFCVPSLLTFACKVLLANIWIPWSPSWQAGSLAVDGRENIKDRGGGEGETEGSKRTGFGSPKAASKTLFTAAKFAMSVKNTVTFTQFWSELPASSSTAERFFRHCA